MSDSARQAFNQIQGKWPKPPTQAQPSPPIAQSIPPASNHPPAEQAPLAAPEATAALQAQQAPVAENKQKSPGETAISRYSEREQKILRDIIGKINFASFLLNGSTEVSVSVRSDLSITFCSPFASHVFDCQAYIREIQKSIPNMSETEETHHRLVWQIATDLRGINGKTWMPGSHPAQHRNDRINRVKEMPRHLLEQVVWAHNLFNTALSIACDAESQEFQDKLKNS